jgi:hypothetical protein
VYVPADNGIEFDVSMYPLDVTTARFTPPVESTRMKSTGVSTSASDDDTWKRCVFVAISADVVNTQLKVTVRPLMVHLDRTTVTPEEGVSITSLIAESSSSLLVSSDISNIMS